MSKEMLFIGIDGGNAGGIVGIQGRKILFMHPMPIIKTTDSRNEYDCLEILRILERNPDATVILEKAHPMPKLGSASAFNFGKSFGTMIGLLTALKIRHHIVHARTWQTALFKDQPHGNTKHASVVVAKRLFPEQDFKVSERSKKPSDGLTDATLLAFYGQNYLYEKDTR